MAGYGPWALPDETEAEQFENGALYPEHLMRGPVLSPEHGRHALPDNAEVRVHSVHGADPELISGRAQARWERANRRWTTRREVLLVSDADGDCPVCDAIDTGERTDGV